VSKIQSPQPEPPRRWSDRQAAAEYLGVAVRTIDTLIASGEIRAYRLPGGRRVLIDLAEVDASIAAAARIVGPVGAR
jgi:excisionase family DNA binding protein